MGNDQNLASLVGVHTQKNFSDQLYQQISSLILSGELEEGYIFPNETVLCEQLQVGRTTLREAYKALELFGYVTRTKRGTSVNSKSSILNATPLKSILVTASNKDFNEFRMMLEPHSAYLAALHAGLSETRELEDIVIKTKEAYARENYSDMIMLDAQFHSSIAKFSNNSLIETLVAVMSSAWEDNIRHNFDDVQMKDIAIFENTIAQHEAITQAIRGRDCEKARSIMKEHIQNVSAI